MKKDLLSFAGMNPEDFEDIWLRAARLKKMLKEGKEHASLKGKTLGMIFDKSSTRTRISFRSRHVPAGGDSAFLKFA